MLDYLDQRCPTDPVYRCLYRAVWEAVHAELKDLTGTERENALAMLEEMKDGELDREDLRDAIYIRRATKVETNHVLLGEGEHGLN
jgi:hypothetical protein